MPDMRQQSRAVTALQQWQWSHVSSRDGCLARHAIAQQLQQGMSLFSQVDASASAGEAAKQAAARAVTAQSAAAAIVADVERRLAAAAQPPPEGGVKALAGPTPGEVGAADSTQDLQLPRRHQPRLGQLHITLWRTELSGNG